MMTVKKTNKNSTTNLQEVLDGLDVDIIGVARIDDIPDTDVARDALALLPGCRSIIVLGMEIYPEFLDLTTGERTAGAPKMNDLLDQHKNFLRNRLTKAAYDFARACRRKGLTAMPLPSPGPSIDTRFLKAAISFKAAAAHAGLGETGMSGLLVTPRYGPRLLLTLCLTEAELAATAQENAQVCRYCNVCVFKCPAHAIGYPKRDEGEKCAVDRFACSQYVVNAGGCSECMRVCPVASPKYG